MTLHIKNMVCPRCVMVVNNPLNEREVQLQLVTLGQATIAVDATTDAQRNLYLLAC